MKTKFIAISLGVALLLASNVSSVADASWLSKAMDRLETSNAKLSPTWPKAEQYRHYRPGQAIGAPLPDEDMRIAGVSLGTSFDAVKASLGQPTSEKRDELTYGGIKFGHSLMQDSRPIVWYMTVSNRDAVTARGIAVGDSLKKVMDIYGRPDFIDFNNRWFYGYLRYNSDNIVGIFFEHNGSKVTKIIISESLNTYIQPFIY